MRPVIQSTRGAMVAIAALNSIQMNLDLSPMDVKPHCIIAVYLHNFSSVSAGTSPV